MGEYEPRDSRNVTLSDHQAPGEPPRTGPREDEAREKAEQGDSTDKADGRPVNQEIARKDAQDAARVHDSDNADGDLHHKL